MNIKLTVTIHSNFKAYCISSVQITIHTKIYGITIYNVYYF